MGGSASSNVVKNHLSQSRCLYFFLLLVFSPGDCLKELQGNKLDVPIYT